jgi:hypothetical protein
VLFYKQIKGGDFSVSIEERPYSVAEGNYSADSSETNYSIAEVNSKNSKLCEVNEGTTYHGYRYVIFTIDSKYSLTADEFKKKKY